MWSTPSSRKAHVVAKSAEAGGIAKGALAAMMVVVVEGIVTQSLRRARLRKQSETNLVPVACLSRSHPNI
jgi:hypothetical protein